MSADAWISAIGTAFAALAAGVAVFQTKKSLERQQIQSHKAVVPIPQVVFGDYVDHLYVKLENAGVGPIRLNEVLVRNETRRITKRSIIDILDPDFPEVVWKTYVGNIDERVISPQASLMLLEYEGDGDEHTLVRAALSRLLISINYTDVYGNVFAVYSRNFSWFERGADKSKSDPVGYATP